ncbi:alpha/beta fold hydrolase [Klenkia terrae]|uniref:alpha/beta fold hydrolase n=1 Tax=Klenkia terrae TaxID=1052259 RepID=UPI003619F2B0
MRIRPVLVLVVLLLAGCRIDGTASPAPDGWEFVSEQPCADAGADGASDFSCVTLSVPVDHAQPAGEHWDVTFGVLRAEGERKGVYVTATGGPGSSGLDVADSYAAAFPDDVRQGFDVVFLDQRGIGLSQELRCDDTYYSYSGFVDTSSTPAERDAFADASTGFGEDCFAEAGVDPATAPRYATAQAVEDLEDFRQWLDAPELTLYGESYGTQYVQTYAAAHPDRVAGLLVDGVVDLATDQPEFAVEQAQGQSDVLVATLARCDTNPVCAAVAPGDSSPTTTPCSPGWPPTRSPRPGATRWTTTRCARRRGRRWVTRTPGRSSPTRSTTPWSGTSPVSTHWATAATARRRTSPTRCTTPSSARTTTSSPRAATRGRCSTTGWTPGPRRGSTSCG